MISLIASNSLIISSYGQGLSYRFIITRYFKSTTTPGGFCFRNYFSVTTHPWEIESKFRMQARLQCEYFI